MLEKMNDAQLKNLGEVLNAFGPKIVREMLSVNPEFFYKKVAEPVVEQVKSFTFEDAKTYIAKLKLTDLQKSFYVAVANSGVGGISYADLLKALSLDDGRVMGGATGKITQKQNNYKLPNYLVYTLDASKNSWFYDFREDVKENLRLALM